MWTVLRELTVLSNKHLDANFRSLYTSDDDCARYLFGIVYICVTNMQGDVLGLRNTSGTEVVRYHYDPWGFVLSATGSLATTVGQNQPLRYRGYVYDEETGLYYLQSRVLSSGMGKVHIGGQCDKRESVCVLWE